MIKNLKKKNNRDFLKKKEERKRSKREIKNSERNRGSVENADKLMSKYAEKECSEHIERRAKFTSQQKHEEELEHTREIVNQIKKKFEDDQMFKEQCLRLIAEETGISYSTTIKSFDKLTSNEQRLIIEKIDKWLQKQENKNNDFKDYTKELEDLKSNKKFFQDKISKLQIEKNCSEEPKKVKKLDEEIESYEKKVEEKNREITNVKKKIDKINKEKIKCPQNLEKLSEFQFDSSKILLDTNAILHMIYRDLNNENDVKEKYEITHKIKTLCNYDSLEVIVPFFVKNELKFVLADPKNKLPLPDFVNDYTNSELKGIFREKMKEEIEKEKEFEKEIENEVEEIIQKHPAVNSSERPLSDVDAKCLLYARKMNAVLITNDQKLLKTCAYENVLSYDHVKNHYVKYPQTTNSYLEEWFVGKIQRLKILWQKIQKSKNNKSNPEKEIKLFEELFCILYESHDDVGKYLDKIFQSKNSAKNIKIFFDTLPDSQNLTFDEIDNVVIQHIYN